MSEIDIGALVGDRSAFHDFVYTPLDEAIAELERRRENPDLMKTVTRFLGNSLLPEFSEKPRAVLARHVITPNYEVTRFLSVPDSTGMAPLFFEYHKDKLIYKNPSKYRLARLLFHHGYGKKGGAKTSQVEVLHLDSAHGKEIASVTTHSGENLVEFHHGLFLSRFPHLKDALFDGSAWYAQNGGSPEKYYSKFLALFVAHGILFENFLLDQKELSFTTDVFLPGFLEVMRMTGVKPLIVALEPTDIEGDEFWISYPHTLKGLVDKTQNEPLQGAKL
jgi:hypothetical protein